MNRRKEYPPGYRKYNVAPIEGGSVMRVLLSAEPKDWSLVKRKPKIKTKIKIPDKFNF